MCFLVNKKMCLTYDLDFAYMAIEGHNGENLFSPQKHPEDVKIQLSKQILIILCINNQIWILSCIWKDQS